MEEGGRVSTGKPYLDDLLPALRWLDRLLERAVIAAQAVYGSKAASDPYRGLYVGHDDATRLLSREPGEPTLRSRSSEAAPGAPGETPTSSPPPSALPAAARRGGLFGFLGRPSATRSNTPVITPQLSEQTTSASIPTPIHAAPAAKPSDSERIARLPPVTGDLPFPDLTDEDTRLGWMARAFNLSTFDLQVLIIGLAPEIDLRYERLYAYLQDDVTRKRPTVDLVLNLLCTSAEEKLAQRAHFGEGMALMRHKLIALIPDPSQVQPPVLGHYVQLDGQVVRLLLGQDTLDPRLAAFSTLIEPAGALDELPLSRELQLALPALAIQSRDERQPLRLYFQGPADGSTRRVAEALAAEVSARLLVVDLAQALNAESDFARILQLVFREAWFEDAILYVEHLDILQVPEHSEERSRLWDALGRDSGVTILAGSLAWSPPGQGSLGVLVVPFAAPGYAQRIAYWESSLSTYGIALGRAELSALADRFRLGPQQIADAAATAYNRSLWRAAADVEADEASEQPTLDDLFAAARGESVGELRSLARNIVPVYSWNDIVLPEDALAQLYEICQRVRYRHVVLDQWGFERRMSQGKGIGVLFTGPPGTGKTMAAEIIARELKLDLYKIDLSSVVSKYIGETEQNLERIFRAAEVSNAILFFDEADSLFTKRSEVRDAHDRYANIEVAYLLQRMEQYEGVAIMATNLRQNMDEAFTRRLQFTVEFPFPDEHYRERIWHILLPPEVPQDPDIDFKFLARQYRIAGGNIRNIVLAAAFLAAGDSAHIGMRYLLLATRREYQKMGQMLTGMDFGPYQSLLQASPASVGEKV